jgi:hypothetical protein
MMGMGQRPPQRPPTGPSPYTMGRPNPMAQGGGANYAPMAPSPQQWGGSFGTGKLGPMGPQGPMGGAQGPPPGWHGGQSTPMMGQIVGGGGMPPQQWGGSYGSMGPPGGGAVPLGQIRGPGMGGGGQWMGGGAQVSGFGDGPTYAPGTAPPDMGKIYDTPQVAYPQGGPQGMSDAMMHPFAPRNRPQFLGAAQGGIMGGMGMGPQMTQGFQGTGQLAPPNQQWMKPWEMRRMQNAIPL